MVVRVRFLQRLFQTGDEVIVEGVTFFGAVERDERNDAFNCVDDRFVSVFHAWMDFRVRPKNFAAQRSLPLWLRSAPSARSSEFAPPCRARQRKTSRRAQFRA